MQETQGATMRIYIIQPCYSEFSELQGYDIECQHDKWKASHGTIDLCETAILRREQVKSKERNKHQIYGKDYKIIYQDCVSEVGISKNRLAFYR